MIIPIIEDTRTEYFINTHFSNGLKNALVRTAVDDGVTQRKSREDIWR